MTTAHQKVLLDQAVRTALTLYDDSQHLLRTSRSAPVLAPVASLEFAALLLARAAADRSRRAELGLARLLIDTVLPLQVRAPGLPVDGAFPLRWQPQRDGQKIGRAITRLSRHVGMGEAVPPEAGIEHALRARLLPATLLEMLTRGFGRELGEKRVQRMHQAVKRTMSVCPDASAASTAEIMLRAWLALEVGESWEGERLATEVVLRGGERLAADRFGDPRKQAGELWSLSLWQRQPRLQDSVSGLLTALLDDLRRDAHPGLPELFGRLTGTRLDEGNGFPWVGSWLTWYAIGGEPMLPKALSDPLDATLFAYPLLARLRFSGQAARVASAADGPELLRVERESLMVSGWREGGLHVEARRTDAGHADRLPAVGASWRSPEGRILTLRCLTSGLADVHGRERSVEFLRAGEVQISIPDLAGAEARLVAGGWWLDGLRLETPGLKLVDAARSRDGLRLELKSGSDAAALRLSPPE